MSTLVSLQDRTVATSRARTFNVKLAISAVLLGPQYVGKRLAPRHAPLVIKREKSDWNSFVWTTWKAPQPSFHIGQAVRLYSEAINSPVAAMCVKRDAMMWGMDSLRILIPLR